MREALSREDSIFLSVLKKAAGNRGLPLETADVDWSAILKKAAAHKLLPLVLDTLMAEKIRLLPEGELKPFREAAVQSTVREVVQTNEFLTIIRHLQEKGLDPAVVKGIVCRELYPRPMLRPSVDEDILVSREDAARADALLREEGLFRADLGEESSRSNTQELPPDAEEFSYYRAGSPTYIEMHIDLFPEESKLFKEWNVFFRNAAARAVPLQVDDVTLRALAPTDHLLFLILHAFQHFVHSGVGIRQVLDIALYVNRYGCEVDWDYCAVCCRSAKAYLFAAALFRIGEKHLGLDPELGQVPADWLRAGEDETDMLLDVLGAGDLGATDINRLHSSRVTLSAAENAASASSGIRRTIFPAKKVMVKQYPFLDKYPVLLPYAWGRRIVGYLGRRRKNRQIDPSESVRIGTERVGLLKKYGIIE